MLYSALALAVCAFSWSASAATQKPKPECVDKCWTNSQYVSLCMGDHQCLCDDAEFQNALYQCLYSQCSTSKFGTALHFALQSCHDESELVAAEHANLLHSDNFAGASIPALFNMDNLKAKRTQSVSNSVTHSATRSVTRSVSASVTRTVTRTGTRTKTRTTTRTKTGSVTRTRPTRLRTVADMEASFPVPTVYLNNKRDVPLEVREF